MRYEIAGHPKLARVHEVDADFKRLVVQIVIEFIRIVPDRVYIVG